MPTRKGDLEIIVSPQGHSVSRPKCSLSKLQMEAVASFLLISKPTYFRAGSPNMKSVLVSSRPSLQARQRVEGAGATPFYY